MTSPGPRSGFDRIARLYRWLELVTFGPLLAACRLRFLSRIGSARRALVLGDGDGRFLARMVAANPAVTADAVDGSSAMLRLAGERVRRAGAAKRVRLHHADALEFASSSAVTSSGVDGGYDLVATHFFLDCLTTAQVRALAHGLRPHLATGCLWVVSEFAIPDRGLARRPSRWVVGSLYLAFGWIAGLTVRQLPDYAFALEDAGFVLLERSRRLGGLLRSDLWVLAERP